MTVRDPLLIGKAGLAIALDFALTVGLARLAGGIACITLGLLLSFNHGDELSIVHGLLGSFCSFACLALDALFFSTAQCLLACSFFGCKLDATLFGTFSFALVARFDHGTTFCFALLHGGIICGGAGTEFLEEGLLGLGSRSLTVLKIVSSKRWHFDPLS
jgi:hypothetical protein